MVKLVKIYYNIFKDLYNNFSDYFMKNNESSAPLCNIFKSQQFENFSRKFLLKKSPTYWRIRYFMKSGEKILI